MSAPGTLSSLRVQDAKNDAFVIRIGERYFRGFRGRRLETAWSFAGATLFLSGDKVEAAVKRLSARRNLGRRPIEVLVVHTGAVLHSMTARQVRLVRALYGAPVKDGDEPW